jgi:hypothetical protein
VILLGQPLLPVLLPPAESVGDSQEWLSYKNPPAFDTLLALCSK